VKRTPGGVWSEILGPAGDGAGHVLDSPNGLAVDAAGNVYVAGFYSDNVFKVEPGGGVSLVLDASSVPGAPLSYPDSLAVDSAGTLYVGASSYVFQVTPGGEASVILDESILGTGNVGDLVVDEFDNLYVAYWTGPVLQRTPWGSVAVLLDEHGGGAGALMESPAGLAVDTAGAVYVAAYWSDNVLRVDSVPECSDGIDNDGDGAIDLADDTGCENPFDRSEQSGYAVCDDGLDNDGDGAIDFPDDAGCRNRAWTYENPACDDDLDNDSDGTIDWDGGSGGAAPDANCVYPWQTRENKKACGLGFEMAPLLAWLWARRRRRRRA
jgi:hypothetical protein